jgi:hypothetical protein
LWRERQIGQVVIPDWVVEDELVVAFAPVVAYASVRVHHESGDTERLEAG